MEEKNINPLDNIIDFIEFLFKIINNWFYFLLSILLALLIAFGYTRYSHEYYRTLAPISEVLLISTCYKTLIFEFSFSLVCSQLTCANSRTMVLTSKMLPTIYGMSETAQPLKNSWCCL